MTQHAFREAVAASEAQRQHEIDAAHHAFRSAIEAVHAAREPAAGPVERELLSRQENDRIAELQRQRDDAIRAADRAHRARRAAAAAEHGILVEPI